MKRLRWKYDFRGWYPLSDDACIAYRLWTHKTDKWVYSISPICEFVKTKHFPAEVFFTVWREATDPELKEQGIGFMQEDCFGSLQESKAIAARWVANKVPEWMK